MIGMIREAMTSPCPGTVGMEGRENKDLLQIQCGHLDEYVKTQTITSSSCLF